MFQRHNFNFFLGPRRKKPFKRVRYNPSPEVSSSEAEDIKEGQKFNVWTKLSADWHDEEDGGRRKQRRNSNSSSARANTPIPYSSAGAGHQAIPAVFSRLSNPRRGHFDGVAGGSRHYSKPAFVRETRSVFDKLDTNPSRKRRIDADDGDGEEKQFFTAGHDSDEEWTSR